MKMTHRLALSAILIASAISSATAEPNRRGAGGYRGDTSSVTAVSKFGNGEVTGAVRYARYGREVRLPGGTWEACRRSCTEALRVATVDFWEARNGTGQECGVFGCLEIRLPR
jgi:hypothetical protein